MQNSNENPSIAENENKYKPDDIIGNYVLQERLGGELSTTFRAVNKVTQEIVAIKIFPKSSKFFYEAETNCYRLLKGTQGILQLKDCGENGQIYFIVTEYILEGSVRSIITKHQDGMDIKEVIQLFAPIADAIDRIHEKNIIHRDLKPENILFHRIDKDYQVFITDFGSVKFTNDSKQFQTEKTAGTSWYISPEAWKADPKISQTKAVDIYALGVMLYEALEGRVPFNNINEVFNNTPIPYPKQMKQKTNELIVEYILRALNKDPRQRSASAKELISEIKNALEGNLGDGQKWIGRVFNNYRVDEVLGLGELGTTLRAIEIQTNKQVVLKAFTRSLFGNTFQAFDNEKKSLKRLENGHGVLTPQESFEQDDILFILTDYQNGGNLRQLLNRKPKGLAISEIIEIFTQLAETIDYIHDNKVIHRDIKPENVVYSINGGKINTFITDFGISVILASAKSSFETKHRAGTYRYMAPELWDPGARKTKSIDIYAFGIMLYEALEGHAPFEAEHPAIMNQHINMPVPLPEITLKELGPDAKNILLEALAKNAEERPKTATEIMQQIKGQHARFLGKRYGKYVIEKFIGRGTYGATYRAHNIDKKRGRFALKILSIPEPNVHEIDILKKIEPYEGILPILDNASENDIHYIVTEYLNGTNLRDMLQDYSQGISLEEILKLFKPVAKALDFLHSKGIIHGDLKPENIILRKNKSGGSPSQPFITDYGISKVVGKAQSLYYKSNIFAGNFKYMAPELWEDKEPSPANDIYALGTIIYEALEGVAPFNAKSPAGIMKQHLYNDPPTPKNLHKHRGENAVRVLLKSLSKEPAQRQKSAQELISELEGAAHNRTSTSIGIFTEPLIKNLGPFSNTLKSNLTTAISLVALLVAVCAFIFSERFSNSVLYVTPLAEPSLTPLAEPSLTPLAEPSLTPLAEPSLVPTLLPCSHQYSSIPSDWKGIYLANKTSSLNDLYVEIYKKAIRNNLDIYAIVYFNNRKAFEEKNLYHIIDPKKLKVELGWRIFLPPPTWIDEYRNFPISILESTNLNNTSSAINISGSSVLAPLSSQMVECFSKATKVDQIHIKPNNGQPGLLDYCQGNVDLFGTSEEITKEVLSKNGCTGTDFYEFEVARFAVTILVSDKNPYVGKIIEKPLTREELNRLLFSANSWNEVRGDFGAESIQRYFPFTESEIFEFVESELFPGWDIYSNIPHLIQSDDDSLIPGKISADIYSIGFSDHVNLQKNKEHLIIVPIDNITPNSDTVGGDNPKYILTRSLYLYVGKTTYDKNPLLRSFINYYLAYEFDFIEKLGYFYPDPKGYKDNSFPTP